MKFFDAHCHLSDFSDFGEIVRCANAAGVERMAVCGINPADWNKISQCLEKYPQIFPDIGIHPWLVSRDWKKQFQGLEKTVRRFPGLGIGETGLDFQKKFMNRAEQEECFSAHLDLACELNLPVTVHCVQAWGRLIAILREHPVSRILLHAFSGAPELIPELIALNGWFSFGGAVVNPQVKRVRASVAAVPVKRLLIETDSVNEPEKLIDVAGAVAELRGTSIGEIARVTFESATEFFHTI